MAQPTLANKLRLLALTEGQQKFVVANGLTERHARAVLRLPEAARTPALEQMATKGLNARQADELVAGLLAMQPDDDRIPNSFAIAKEIGLHFHIGTINLRGAHPNTAVLRLTGASGRKLEVVGASIGGGRINICQIDGITTNFGGDHNTLIVHNQDTPGHVAAVTTCLSEHGVNIATMQLYRSTAGGYAVMVLECDEPIPDEIAGQLRSQPGIVKVTILNW